MHYRSFRTHWLGSLCCRGIHWYASPTFTAKFPRRQEHTIMDRRRWLKSTLLGSGAIGLPWLARGVLGADDRPATIAEEAARGTPPLQISDIQTILTAPAN